MAPRTITAHSTASWTNRNGIAAAVAPQNRPLGRALRPGGWAALQVSDDPDIHRPRQGARQPLLATMGRAPRGQRHPAWLGSRADLDAIAVTAGECGVTVQRVWGRGTQYCQVLLRRAG